MFRVPGQTAPPAAPAPGDGRPDPVPTGGRVVREYRLGRQLPAATPRPAGDAPAEARRLPGDATLDRPISRKQTTSLVLLAREAFDALVAGGAIDAGESFDAWRRACVVAATGGEATGTSSANGALDRHFLEIRGKFRQLRGQLGPAFADALAADLDTQKKNRALHALKKLCLDSEYPWPGYADAIALSKFKRRAQALTARQAWSIHHDITKNGRRKARRPEH